MELKFWKMTYEEYKDIPCSVPCTLYGTLLENNLIEDPFYRLNEKKYTELCEKDCVFETVFAVDEEMLKKDYACLSFYGIDTVCNIYLNEKILAAVDNMHRTYAYDVKDKLICGENKLRIEIKSPIKYMEKMNEKYFLWSNADSIPGICHLRKAYSMSGWDWGPKLPDMGIFRKVVLDFYDIDKIDDVFVVQNHHNDGSVTLSVNVATKHGSDVDAFAEIDGQRLKLEKGCGEITIENPKLWWVRGYGEQPLYELKTEIFENDEKIDEKIIKIGLRTLKVSTKPEYDKWGVRTQSDFCFVNNGVEIFARGANYLIEDNVLSRVTKERTENLLSACVDANYNCIRVWGGGYYPDEYFYDFCDEHGIIIWQDFMSACYGLRLTKDYENNYINEAKDVLKRFRNHASLGILCGNNEMEYNLKKLPPVVLDSEKVRADYFKLFEDILPEICEEMAPQTFYWPSSPSSGGGFEEIMNKERGDWHYWESHENFKQYKIRFCSEFGIVSYPNMKTIKTYAEKEDLNCFSEVMDSHLKAKTAQAGIWGYISKMYRAPEKFEDFVFVTQCVQADLIKNAVCHLRSNRDFSRGALYWQLNDCWPCESWSSIDYFGRYKALHYAAKRFYAPIMISASATEGVIKVNLSNETQNDISGNVKIKVCRNDFSVIWEKNIKDDFKKLSAKDVFCGKAEYEDEKTNYIVCEFYDDNNNLITKDTALLTVAKYYKWEKSEIKTSFKKLSEEKTEMTVESNKFTKGVFVDFESFDVLCSDNWFDITDDGKYKIILKTDKTEKELSDNLIIKTVNSVGI